MVKLSVSNNIMFKIAIIGKTNVGKSALFNRISGTKNALMFDRPGVTRDIREHVVDILGKQCVLLDTPGIFDYRDYVDNPILMKAIKEKLEEVIKESDLIIFVIDGTIGLTEYDKDIAKMLRKQGKENIILAINKNDRKISKTTNIEALELGFNNTVPISAEHGDGISDLLEIISSFIPEDQPNAIIPTEIQPNIIKLAIVGRPNVGKSTIVNMVLNDNKRLVADMAGVTRESSEQRFSYDNRDIVIIDTPGMRKRSRVEDHLEKISMSLIKKAYRNADVVILVIDGTSLSCGEIERQDILLASHIIREGKPLIIAINKVDLTPYDKDSVPDFLYRNLRSKLSQLKNVPVILVCGINGDNIPQMLSTVVQTYDKQFSKIKTSDLNNWLSAINKSDVLQSGSAQFKLKYITQVDIGIPKFIVFGSNTANIKSFHQKFIQNSLKEHFNLKEIPIQIFYKEGSK